MVTRLIFAAKVITITKRFGNAAAVVGTEECNESIDVFGGSYRGVKRTTFNKN